MKRCAIMVDRPGRSGDFAGNDHQRGGRTPALLPVRLVDRFPDSGFNGGHRGVKQQAAQLGGAVRPRVTNGGRWM